MADPVGAVLEGVVDQFEVGWLGGVDRDVEMALASERECLGVQRRWPTGFGARQVERDHLVVVVAQAVDQLHDLERALLGAHRAAGWR